MHSLLLQLYSHDQNFLLVTPLSLQSLISYRIESYHFFRSILDTAPTPSLAFSEIDDGTYVNNTPM